ncbi:MAG: serine--tRNA ligase, partial [Pseudomonadota bacterium]|nr:serine--tRNA ligase [Pseudomonadota bacterium]
MFDIRAIRDNPDAFRAAFERKQKGLGEVVSHMLDHDAAVRKAVSDKQEAEAARNAKSKEIGKAKASGDEALFEQLRKEVADAKDVIEAAGEQEAAARAELDKLLYGTPNIPLPDVPEGEDEDGNVEQHKWGEPNALLGGRNNVQDHADLGAGLKNAIDQPLMDFEAAAAMSGARFVALRGQLARLERALASFMLDKQTLENGYEETNPPLLVREEALIGTGQLPKFGEDSFQTTDGHWLIATSEISLTNLVREQILADDKLPIRMTGHTPCFRSEAGSAGRDTKGMIRLHQFNKVEMVSIVRDEKEGLAELERMTNCAETILQRLNLPYRVIKLCSVDTGFSAQQTYDLEVWLAGQ